MPGMQPQPPKKDGPNLALIIILVMAVLGATGLGGCLICMYIGSRSSSSPSSSGGSTKPTSATENWITSERPFVKFLQPPGWVKNIKGDWGIFKAPDNDAVFAFTTFNQPNESTERLGNAAWALGVSDINWGSAKFGTVGRDNFKARMGEGTCNFQGPGGYIWYATVDSGTADQILLIYAVSARGDKNDKEAALTSIRSLQRR